MRIKICLNYLIKICKKYTYNMFCVINDFYLTLLIYQSVRRGTDDIQIEVIKYGDKKSYT